jgi:hypothetical protein
MVDLQGLTDQQLLERYARVDLRVRQMENWSPLMDQLDNVLEAIRAEQARRRMEAGND